MQQMKMSSLYLKGVQILRVHIQHSSVHVQSLKTGYAILNVNKLQRSRLTNLKNG